MVICIMILIHVFFILIPPISLRFLVSICNPNDLIIGYGFIVFPEYFFLLIDVYNSNLLLFQYFPVHYVLQTYHHWTTLVT